MTKKIWKVLYQKSNLSTSNSHVRDKTWQLNILADPEQLTTFYHGWNVTQLSQNK